MELKKLYKGFIDPRRATAWAIVYEGLKIWELASKKYELEWRAPPYTDFVEQVIDKIALKDLFGELGQKEIYRKNLHPLFT